MGISGRILTCLLLGRQSDQLYISMSMAILDIIDTPTLVSRHNPAWPLKQTAT
jgi:hypothetical protein